MKSLSTRKITVLAISAAPPYRRSGVALMTSASSSGVRSAGANIGPGAIAFTRISGASSSARLSVSATTAALDV